MSYSVMVASSLLSHTPELVAWLVGIVLAMLMVRRGGGRAEKLLLAGCSLMFVVQLASPFLSGLVSLLLREGWRTPQTVGLFLSLPMGILGLAGLVCLVFAFWVRFWARRQELA